MDVMIILETGSLIRLKKNVKDIIIPSEEEHIEMFPLDFEEFLWAMGDEVTTSFIRECFEKKMPLGQGISPKGYEQLSPVSTRRRNASIGSGLHEWERF